MSESENTKKADDLKLVQGRSPAYPFIALDKALERLEAVNKAGGARQALPPETFYKIWDIGPQSSSSRQTMAALNHFGLVEYIGRGDDRKVKLTPLALRIVLDRQPTSLERREAIREAALTPPIHKDLFEKYGSLMPADVVIETYLTRDRGYNANAADALIGEYKSTLVYAGLDKPDNLSDNPPVKAEGAKDETPKRAKVGDLVQWESGGCLRLPGPKRVTGLTEGGDFAFIEGSLSGVPVAELTVVQASEVMPLNAQAAGGVTASADLSTAPIKPAPVGARQDVFTLDEGQVVLQYPAKMSAASYEDFEAWLNLQLKKIKRGIDQ